MNEACVKCLGAICVLRARLMGGVIMVDFDIAITAASVALVCVGMILLLHHGWHHSSDSPDSNAKAESCAAVCFFQPNDIYHLETAILLLLGNALCLTIGVAVSPSCCVEQFPLAGVYCMIFCLFFVGCGLVCVSFFARPRDKCGASSVVHSIANHETWIVLCFTCALSLWVAFILFVCCE